MRRALSLGALALVLAVPVAAGGQSKTIPGDLVTVTAKVEAIEHGSRTLTLRREGHLETIVVPEGFTKFSEIKVGDTVTARYYDSVTIRKKAPGEPSVDSAAANATRPRRPSPREQPRSSER